MGWCLEYIRKIRNVLICFLCFAIIQGILCFLYDVPAEPLIYGTVLCGIVGGFLFFYEYRRYIQKKKVLLRIKKNLPLDLELLPVSRDETEKLYQEIIEELNAQRMRAENRRQKQYEEINDYYTMWVHQIKTPISAMRLLLQEESGKNQAELGELFKIEQYVEMVLGYLRTEDMSADMVFSEQELDGIIREQIHKYAGIFVRKKLMLEYEGVQECVLTDAKWLGFVIGQILSNSLKYTNKGKIAIYMSADRRHTLVIEDTGIGIAGQDIPRVFEKGFTGHNGRADNRSTGIGLYLCAKIMRKLNHEISIESRPGEGTKVYLALGRKKLDMYS